VVDRIREEVPNPRLRERLIEDVELGRDLDNPEASTVYDLDAEPGADRVIQKILIGAHAQYRADLRGITIPQIRAALRSFQKQMNDWKSQQDFRYDDRLRDLNTQGVGINYTDSHLDLTIVFVAAGSGAVRIITTYWEHDAKPTPPGIGGCPTDKEGRSKMTAIASRVAARHLEAIGWKNFPKGWTKDSVKKFWSNLTGDVKHKVTKCIDKMQAHMDDPGAFCASCADTVEGTTMWRSPKWKPGKKAAVSSKILVSRLPKSIQYALKDARFQGTKIRIDVDHTYQIASPGDDGTRGFTAVVDLASGHYDLLLGAWGGGSLGAKQSPVDVDFQKRPLPENTVVVQGQQGGAPYAFLVATPETTAMLMDPPRK